MKFLFLYLCCTALIFAPSWSQPERTHEATLFYCGVKYFEAKNYSLAQTEFEEYSRSFPDGVNREAAEFQGAMCDYHEGRYTDALIQFQNMLIAHPHHSHQQQIKMRIAEIHFRKDAFGKAQQLYLEVFESPTSGSVAADAMYWAGECAVRLRARNVAEKYFILSIEHLPQGSLTDRALFSLGNLYESDRRYSEAKGSYDRLVREYPSSALVPSANTHIAQTLIDEQQYLRALQFLESISDSPDAENVAQRLLFRAETNAKLGHFIQAEELLSSFMTAYPQDERIRSVLYSRAIAYAGQKKYSEALRELEPLTKRHDQIGAASLYQKGIIYHAMLQHDQEAQAFEELANSNAASKFREKAFFELGMNAFERKNHASAEERFAQLLKDYPESTLRGEAHYLIGESQTFQEKYNEAITSFVAVIENASVDSSIRKNALLQKAKCELRIGEAGTAVKSFGQFLRNYHEEKDQVQGLLWRAEAQSRNKDYRGAIETYQNLQRRFPQDTLQQEALFGLASSAFQLGTYEQAEQSLVTLTKQYRAGKHDVEANLMLGEVQRTLGRSTDAAATFRYACRMYPKNEKTAYAFLRLAQIDYENGNTAPAINTLKMLLDHYPQSPYCDDAQFYIGWYFLQKKDYAVALSELFKLLALHPQSPLAPKALYHLGISYFSLDRIAEARNTFQEIILRFPQSSIIAETLQALSLCYQALGNKEKADAVAKEYLQANPDTAQLAESLAYQSGMDLYRQGRYEDAVKVFQNYSRSYSSNEKYPNVLLCLAESFFQLGQTEEAGSVCEKIHRSYPSHPSNVDAAILHARLAKEDQQYQQALAYLTDALPFSAMRRSEILFERAAIFKYLAQMDSARKDYSDASLAVPATNFNDRAEIQLSLIDAQAGALTDAVERLRTIASERQDDIGAEAQFSIGQLLLDAKRYKDAERELKKVEEYFSSSMEMCARSILALGVCYQLQGSNPKARAAYRRVIDRYNNSTAASEAGFRLNRMQ